jgi:hypothetical protein
MTVQRCGSPYYQPELHVSYDCIVEENGGGCGLKSVMMMMMTKTIIIATIIISDLSSGMYCRVK